MENLNYDKKKNLKVKGLFICPKCDYWVFCEISQPQETEKCEKCDSILILKNKITVSD